ncbi:hypothetical protein E3N88_13935 [Mikania micrantha]|uniref:Uncharacterized protein n=1 Tax=Mikania micrantha TaxID=192012 RepID=A0A5N6P330_9ASTR|nr:hypothetical protein E3N88_13935 [Mikania micrantha]
MDSSRYAKTPWRKASRYAKQSGSRDSRIPSRYTIGVLIGLRVLWTIGALREALGSYQHAKESSSTISRTYCCCYNSNLHI